MGGVVRVCALKARKGPPPLPPRPALFLLSLPLPPSLPPFLPTYRPTSPHLPPSISTFSCPFLRATSLPLTNPPYAFSSHSLNATPCSAGGRRPARPHHRRRPRHRPGPLKRQTEPALQPARPGPLAGPTRAGPGRLLGPTAAPVPPPAGPPPPQPRPPVPTQRNSALYRAARERGGKDRLPALAGGARLLSGRRRGAGAGRGEQAGTIRAEGRPAGP